MHMFVADRAPGELLRAFGTFEFKEPRDLCASSNDELLFVADCDHHQVQVLSVSSGEHVRTLGSRQSGDKPGEFVYTSSLCLAPGDDSEVFGASIQFLKFTCSDLFKQGVIISPVSDMHNHRVQVLDAVDGSHKRFIGRTDPRATDPEAGRRGAHQLTSNLRGHPMSVRVSNGEVFVVCEHYFLCMALQCNP